ncbi:AI-2E family transporter [Lactobacillus psittaci]|uniref:Permease n=1 Tax=Lactobacillus psittaci DSM 15354 TaxID=1122152 RepID=A0A0R1S4L8_9LACO|nr:AI-2E family transporter [Lactobacillus psittaci]KRL63868.1 permease [Lactobacillus psittaci DSM 15354]
MEKKKNKGMNLFRDWFLNNRFTVSLLNILLFFLIIWLFNEISFVLQPAWIFLFAVLPPIILATVQYYLMNPVVDFFQEKLKVPRIVTILLLFLLVLGLLIWMINSLIPLIQSQVDSLVRNWPKIWKSINNITQDLLHDSHFKGIKSNLFAAINNIEKNVFKSWQDTANLAISNISSAVSVFGVVFMTLLTAPFVLFYMLKDGHKLNAYLTQFAPRRWQDGFSSMLHDINEAVGSYVRGQIVVAFWVGIIYAIGYNLIGLPYGTALAVFAAFMLLIPYFGTFIALIPVLIIAAITSWGMLINVLIVFVIEQTIETRFISPFVVGNRMKMHPITTILLLIGASAVWGLPGVIFGIPIYAVIKIIVTRSFNYFREVSRFYNDEDLFETQNNSKIELNKGDIDNHD